MWRIIRGWNFVNTGGVETQGIDKKDTYRTYSHTFISSSVIKT